MKFRSFSTRVSSLQTLAAFVSLASTPHRAHRESAAGRRWAGGLILAMSGALAGGCAHADPGVTVETVAEGLEQPWAMTFLPDGDLLVTQRAGTLLRIDPDSGETTPIHGVPDVHAQGQGGLLDVALHPAFEQNRWVYLTYSAAANGGTATHLARGRLNDEATRLEDVETLFVAGPAIRSNGHYGSRIVFDHDGDLFLTSGDRQSKAFGPEHPAQDLSGFHGKVLRLHDDGRIPADNPFVGRIDAEDAIFSYGHRNPQGMAVHPDTGAVWINEHGEFNGDEINILASGGNFGWPIATWAVDYRTRERFAPTPPEVAETVDPVFWWAADHPQGFPPSGLAFYNAEAFPEWQGHALMGNLRHQYLGLFSVGNAETGAGIKEVGRLLEDRRLRIRDVRVGPTDGFVYVIAADPRSPLLRLRPNASD